jgi:hypothetical protein
VIHIEIGFASIEEHRRAGVLRLRIHSYVNSSLQNHEFRLVFQPCCRRAVPVLELKTIINFAGAEVCCSLVATDLFRKSFLAAANRGLGLIHIVGNPYGSTSFGARRTLNLTEP